jgi:hypothetical protein
MGDNHFFMGTPPVERTYLQNNPTSSHRSALDLRSTKHVRTGLLLKSIAEKLGFRNLDEGAQHPLPSSTASGGGIQAVTNWQMKDVL